MKRRIVIGLLILCTSGVSKVSDACSSFFFGKNGYSLVAHNMEWIHGDGMIMVNKRHVQKWGFQVDNTPEFQWTSKYGSITFNMEGRELTGRGINEAGLTIFEMALSASAQSRTSPLPILSVAQWTQYQLDTSATIEDIIASDKVVHIWPDDMQSQFLVLDRSGTPAVIEWLGGEMVVYRDSTLPVPVLVNSTYESCLANGDDPSGRFKTIVDGLEAYDTATSGDGLSYTYSILKSASDMLSAPVKTHWHVVYDTHAQRLYFTTVKNPQLRYLDLKDFDFSCETDVLLLDINGSGSGNIRSAFVPYTTDLDAAQVRLDHGISASYGLITPDDMLNKMMTFPDCTVCTDSGKGGSTGRSAGSESCWGAGGSSGGSTGGAAGGAAGSSTGGVGGGGTGVGGATSTATSSPTGATGGTSSGAGGITGAATTGSPAGGAAGTSSGAGGTTGAATAGSPAGGAGGGAGNAAGTSVSRGGPSGSTCQFGGSRRDASSLVAWLLALGLALKHYRRSSE
jgi:penicillin V acylase-like amidase (Ntn superfamily)